MNIDLKAICERQERHFESLSDLKSSSESPVFALEHSLSEDERSGLIKLFNSPRKYCFLKDDYWLLWVLYAAEIGYSYDGSEYWPSFGGQYENIETSNRNRIKKWFIKFKNKYSGVKPTGKWAEHFTIISWPITHAILPTYLQKQFARTLFDLRHNLIALPSLEPLMIGKLLANKVNFPSNRFQEFLEQEELIGRIVLALLGDEASLKNQPIIYDYTLKRIFNDLNSINSSRLWLNDTKTYVSDRFKGLGREPIKCRPIDPQKISKLQNICPNLILQIFSNVEQLEPVWAVWLEFSSFHNLTTIHPKIGNFINSTRFELNGGTVKRPGNWLLSRNRKAILNSWPKQNSPLIKFESSNIEIDQLINAECQLGKEPNWLFKVKNDGTARHIKSRIVRPGNQYIVLTTEEFQLSNEFICACSINCDGVNAYKLIVPTYTSEEFHDFDFINKLDLQIARTVEVWPAGIPCSFWDGEGNSEWLTTENPCIGIHSDHPVEAYSFSINEDPPTKIMTKDATEPLFISLQKLPVGTYKLTVIECRSSSLQKVTNSKPAEGILNFYIREPDHWKRDTNTYSGLYITLDPPQNDLNLLSQNKINPLVVGPENYSVSVEIRLFDSDKKLILKKQIGQNFELPFKLDNWRNEFKTFLKSNEELFIEASSGTLTFDGGVMGRKPFLFEQESKPLRWFPKINKNQIQVRLIDDTGVDTTNGKYLRYNFSSPLTGNSIPDGEVLHKIEVKSPGELLFAKIKDYSDAVAISNLRKSNSQDFSVLKLNPTIPEEIDVIDTIKLLAFWYDARALGQLVNLTKNEIVDAIISKLYQSFYGKKWFELEKKFRGDLKSSQVLEELESSVSKTNLPQFTNELHSDWENIVIDPKQRILRFQKAANYSEDVSKEHLCIFALYLASQPHKLITIPEIDKIIKKYQSNTTTLRGARLLALLTMKKNNTSDQISPGWEW